MLFEGRQHIEQHGAAGIARRAHNPEVPRSKRGAATFFLRDFGSLSSGPSVTRMKRISVRRTHADFKRMESGSGCEGRGDEKA